MSVRILNANLLSITRIELLQSLKRGVLVTPNLDHLVKLQHDREFYDLYQKAEWVVCDSKILYLCSRLLKKGIPEAIPGSSFFTAFYQYHKDNPDCRIFLLGAMEGVAQKAMERINASVGREIVVGAMSPSYGFENKPEENELIYRTINASGANVVLVGVGAPKQEKWIFRHKSRMPGVDIWMALGATIDFEAGNVKRAPKIFRRLGLEWFHRLITQPTRWRRMMRLPKLAMEWFYRFLMEPKRMFRRYFVDDVKFFLYFGRQLLGIYRNPFKS